MLAILMKPNRSPESLPSQVTRPKSRESGEGSTVAAIAIIAALAGLLLIVLLPQFLE